MSACLLPTRRIRFSSADERFGKFKAFVTEFGQVCRSEKTKDALFAYEG